MSIPEELRELSVAADAADYAALLRGDHAEGPAGSVLFCVYTADPAEGRGDVYVAAGLARSLVRRGWGVRFLPRNRWASLPGDPADVVVAMLPSLDVGLVARRAVLVGWARNEIQKWLDHPQLALFDLVLASSRLAHDALAERYAGPTGVLPIGVDHRLFAPSDEPRSDAVISTVNHWGRDRDLHKALASYPSGEHIVLYGETRALPESLHRFSAGKVGYFQLPSAYRRSAVVLDDMNHTTLPYGSMNSRVFESLACGAMVATNGALGLAELGLADLPVYRTPQELVGVLDGLRSDPATARARATALQQVVLREHTFDRRAEVFDGLVRPVLDARGGEPSGAGPVRRTVALWPDYRIENPYQDMLYATLPAGGTQVVPAGDLMSRPIPRDGGGRLDGQVLHIHWTAPILGPATGLYDAQLRLDRFQATVRDVLHRGARLVWTVHNVLPHECAYPAVEVRLSRFLAEHADLIHVMSEETLDAVAGRYVLPRDKVRVIPHASYVGVYPDFVSRSVARRRLGVLPHEVALLVLGGIRPYKGLDRLLDVFDRVCREELRLRLLVAGKPGRFPDLAEWRRRCEEHPRIVSDFSYVPDADLQVWCRAADVAVLPYRSILNSGSFQLALSFGLPVIGPTDGALRSLLDPAYCLSFDPADDRSLAEAVRQAPTLANRATAARARQAANRWTVADMAAAFAAALDEVVPAAADRPVAQPKPLPEELAL